MQCGYGPGYCQPGDYRSSIQALTNDPSVIKTRVDHMTLIRGAGCCSCWNCSGMDGGKGRHSSPLSVMYLLWERSSLRSSRFLFSVRIGSFPRVLMRSRGPAGDESFTGMRVLLSLTPCRGLHAGTEPAAGSLLGSDSFLL